MNLKFVDMFCGMGTIRMGFEQAGWECVYSIEWDNYKRKIYEVIFGNEPEGSDIREVKYNDIPRADCWTFGAPCQDFSIAGTRSGMEGDRSSLVREVFRLIRETEEKHRPEWLLYENVKGMLSSNKGLDYLEILSEMESFGYDIQWQIINSKDFGVPQNRERVFTIGHLRRRGRREIFPIGYIPKSINTTGKKNNKQLAMSFTAIKVIRVVNVSNTLLACGPSRGIGNNNPITGVLVNKTTNWKLRKLTPKECMRLQGIPDYITNKLIEAKISDTQMYIAAGDACTRNVIYEIANKIKNSN